MSPASVLTAATVVALVGAVVCFGYRLDRSARILGETGLSLSLGATALWAIALVAG